MTQESAEAALEGILNEMLDYAAEDGLMPEDTITYRDLFDTKIMSMLVPRPSEVIKKFQALYQISPKEATDYFYKLSRDTNYIRRYRIKKDQKWTADTEFGTLDITINLSKPEKDPKAIAAAPPMMKIMLSGTEISLISSSEPPSISTFFPSLFAFKAILIM